MTVPRGGISVGQKLRLVSAGMLIVICVFVLLSAHQCKTMSYNLSLLGFRGLFVQSGAFILIHCLIPSPVYLIYQNHLTWTCPPFLLLYSLLIFVSTSPLFYMKWKIKNEVVCTEPWPWWLKWLLMIVPGMPRHDFNFLLIPALAVHTGSTVHSLTSPGTSPKRGSAVPELLL